MKYWRYSTAPTSSTHKGGITGYYNSINRVLNAEKRRNDARRETDKILTELKA